MAWTYLQMQNKALGWLDDAGDSDRMRAMVQQVLNDANIARATEYPWTFMRATSTLTVTSGNPIVALPADFYRAWQIQVPGTNEFAMEIPARSIQELGPNPSLAPWPYNTLYGLQTPFYYDTTTVTSGDPPVTETRKAIVLVISPTSSSTLTLKYYKNPTEMTLDGDYPDIPWPHSQVLVYDALLDLKAYAAESSELLPFWIRRRDDALRRLYESQKSDQTLGSWGQYVHTQDV